jgi:low temperature requirement protein LtrA
VVTGATLAAMHRVDATELAAFLIAVLGTMALWWVYFDRSAREAARVIAESADPGRLGRSAYHLLHPVMVAGVIVVAAADDRVLAAPGAAGAPDVAWLVLGGPALFLAGHAAFKWVVWRRVSWQRVAAVSVLGLLGAAAPYLSSLALCTCAATITAAVAACDRLQQNRETSAHSPG